MHLPFALFDSSFSLPCSQSPRRFLLPVNCGLALRAWVSLSLLNSELFFVESRNGPVIYRGKAEKVTTA